MAKTIIWKVPTNNLIAQERVILRYLEEQHEANGRELERCPSAIGRAVYPSYVAPESRASQNLRKLILMGLVERVQEYGFVYYNRVQESEGTEDTGEWVDGDALDLDVFRTDEACSIMQVLGAKHPEPITYKEIADNVLCDGNQPRARQIAEALIRSGYAKQNKYILFLTERGEEFCKTIKNRANAERVVMEYLIANQDNQQKCRETNLAVNALGLDPERIQTHIRYIIRPLVKKLIEEKKVYRVQNAASRFWWLRVPHVDTVDAVKHGTKRQRPNNRKAK